MAQLWESLSTSDANPGLFCNHSSLSSFEFRWISNVTHEKSMDWLHQEWKSQLLRSQLSSPHWRLIPNPAGSYWERLNRPGSKHLPIFLRWSRGDGKMTSVDPRRSHEKTPWKCDFPLGKPSQWGMMSFQGIISVSIAIENGPFVDYLSIKNGCFP